MSLVQRLIDAAVRNENDYGEAETGALLREAARAIQSYELKTNGVSSVLTPDGSEKKQSGGSNG